MLKFILWIPLLANILFSYSLEQTININVHRSYDIGVIGVNDTETTDSGLGMDLPLSSFIGVHAGICELGSGGDVYKPVITGEVGLIQMYSTKYISPYSIQYFQLGYFDNNQESKVDCFLNVNIGVELLGNYPVKPFVEAGFSMVIHHLAERFGGGLRFSY